MLKTSAAAPECTRAAGWGLPSSGGSGGKDDEEGDLSRVGTISYQRNKATTSIEGIHTVDTWTLCWLPTVCLVCMSGSSCTVRALALSGLLSGRCARGILWLCLQNTKDAVSCSC